MVSSLLTDEASYGIDSWYDQLKEHTFRTELVSLTYEEAIAITHRYQKVATDEENDMLEKVHHHSARQCYTLTFGQLAARLDIVIQNAFERRCFIKLNTRR